MFKKFVALLIVVILLRIFIFVPVDVHGDSMLPTTKTGDRYLVDQISQNFGSDFQRGQIVVYCADNKNCNEYKNLIRVNKTFYIKRVIGLPNESIEIKDNQVIIYNAKHPDGMVLKEDYLKIKTPVSDFPKTEIPTNNFFIMGDNRGNSTDSRIFGAVPKQGLLGKTMFLFWPLNAVKLTDLPQYD